MSIKFNHTNRFFKLGLILVSGIILASYTFCNREGKDQILVKLISQALSIYHFNPQTIDDSFSAKVFDLYMKNLDFGKRFLTKKDLKELEVYKTQIDDQINAGSVEFYTRTKEVYDANTSRIQRYYIEILSKPFDFSVTETYQTDPEKSEYPADTIALKDTWRKSLKYQALIKVNDALKIQDSAKNLPDSARKTFAKIEEEARLSLLKLYNNYFKRIKQAKEIDNFSVFINAIAGVYDPHTQYFSPRDKENFDMGMSGQLEGIGAVLQQSDDNYVKVASIVAGSPSWLQGDLKANDVILKVAQENQEPVDIFDMPLDDVVKQVRGKKGTKVTLTVRKLDKSIKEITITRDVVIIEETYAKSSVINSKGNKYGYILLPSFYSNFEQKATGRYSSEDVAAEIKKLQAENVKGIILDLRNNGGGSLADAVRIGGLFIPQGPIVQVKSNFGPAKTHNDPDPAVQYNGPLVIMVNSLSASASEILAAAMQDYKRAIILGSTATFGKGTVQQFIELDNAVPASYKDFQPLGSLKITIQKYYRINGGTPQLKGVIPDIIMPDIYSDIEIGEREQDYCMPWSEIAPAKYQPYAKMLNFEKIVQNENVKISTNNDFKTIKQQASLLKKQRDQSVVDLNFDKFKSEEASSKTKVKELDELLKNTDLLKIEASVPDINKFKNDTASLTRLNTWVKDLKKDVYLKEAVEVIGQIEMGK